MANHDNIKGLKVLIVGFGKSGVAACQAMIRLKAEVTVQDSKKEEQIDRNLLNFFREKGVRFYLNSMPPDMGAFDMMILSPGVSPELSFVQEAKAKGVEITGELEIAYRIGRGNYVAITGTNGKTTTTTLVGEIFKEADRKTHVVGNIGVAVISESLEAGENDWLVTECSSFQLETIRYFKPKVSAILNLTPDHLNRHHTMEAYGAAKARIFENQSEDGFLVANYDDKLCWSLTEGAKAVRVPFSIREELPFGAFVKDGRMVIRNKEGELIDIAGTDELRIIGEHNVMNALAAAAISYFAGIDPAVIGKAIREFPGVEHRIEYSGTVDGVKYYNDSKGTNTDAAITAIKAVKENIILIAGGDAKSQDFTELVKYFPGHVKEVILLGRDAPMIRDAMEKAGLTNYVFCKDMMECVRKASEIAEEGDNVLLSPACASWDMYDNFEQRGRHFKDCVSRLSR